MGQPQALQRLELAQEQLDTARYALTLFVSGASSSSARAIRNTQALCAAHLEGRYDLTVIDVNEHPELAQRRRVLATPTLLKDHPAPQRMLVGDLSDARRVLDALDVPLGDAGSSL